MQEALLGTNPNKLKKGGIYYLALQLNPKSPTPTAPLALP